jgi:putative flippase GtrA
MRSRIDKVLEWSRTHQGRKLIRFTCVSAVSTATSLTVITLVYGVFHWGVVWSTVFGNVVATVPSYYLNRSWTWGKRGRSHLVKEIIPFWSMSSLGITFSFFGSLLARHIVKTNAFPHIANTLIVDAANFFSFAIFWVLKLIVFNKIFNVSELDEVEEHLEHEEELAREGEDVSP